jgi:hypothetical protein
MIIGKDMEGSYHGLFEVITFIRETEEHCEET